KNIRIAYQLALCYYIKNNEISALQYIAQIQKVPPGDYDRNMDEESSMYELYVLQDQAEWMRQNLQPVQVMPSGQTRPLQPVKYADFSIKPDPELPGRVCYESLNRVKELLPKLVR